MTLLNRFLWLFGIIQDPETIEQARTRITIERQAKQPCWFYHKESANGKCAKCLIDISELEQNCGKLND